MGRKLNAHETVSCPVLPGDAKMPAECCVLRTLWQGKGYRRNKSAYPECAACLIGKRRRERLEADGWAFDRDAIRKRISARLKAERKAARRLYLAAQTVD